MSRAQRSVYHPRDPTASPLWRCLDAHYADFRRNYPATYHERHGFSRPVVDEEVEDYLECGDLRNGFARIRCTAPGLGAEAPVCPLATAGGGRTLRSGQNPPGTPRTRG